MNPNCESEPPSRALYRSLSDVRRRFLLALVRERSPDGARIDDLATDLATFESDRPPIEVTDAEQEHALVELYHRHLPALEDAGVVERADGVVIATEPPDVAESILELATDRTLFDDESVDALFAAMAHPRRRRVLSVLGEQFGPISTRTLARAVAAAEAGTDERAVPRDAVDSVHVSLAHTHLPHLADAALVEYDADGRILRRPSRPSRRLVRAPGAGDCRVDRGTGLRTIE